MSTLNTTLIRSIHNYCTRVLSIEN